MVIDKILRLKKIGLDKAKMPKHVAITIKGHYAWARKNKKDIGETYEAGFETIKKVMKSQAELSIPVLSMYLLSENMPKNGEFSQYSERLEKFLTSLKEESFIHENKIKINVWGKWYDLPSTIIEPIKSLLDETKDYDGYFLNICINYNGQEEIVDACRLIARKIKAEKLEPESITRDEIKDNVYSSAFMPPDLIIITGYRNELSGILLWDASYARLYFGKKPWPEFNVNDVIEALLFYQK